MIAINELLQFSACKQSELKFTNSRKPSYPGWLRIGNTPVYTLWGVTDDMGRAILPLKLEILVVEGLSSTGNPIAAWVSDENKYHIISAPNSKYACLAKVENQ